MKHLTRTFGYIISGCVLMVALYSCNGNTTSNYTQCEDSLVMLTKAAAAANADTAGAGMANTNDSANANSDMNGAYSSGDATNDKNRMHKKSKRESGMSNMSMSNEPTGPGTLHVTSSAFGNNSVIPVKYTCDGQGVTPPLNVTNIPPGTKSLTLIVHDYNATPEGGFTYWIIWNLDTLGVIPENFRNSHEAMNAAKEYGNTPLCARSGNHKYHFIFYAIDSRLVIGKNTTKSSIENVMRGHILAKGELVGIYNKHLE